MSLTVVSRRDLIVAYETNRLNPRFKKNYMERKNPKESNCTVPVVGCFHYVGKSSEEIFKQLDGISNCVANVAVT